MSSSPSPPRSSPHAVATRGSTTSVYALTQLQDTLLKIDPATGKNSTVGQFSLHDDYNPVATQLSAILGDRMYFLALNKTGMNTDLIEIDRRRRHRRASSTMFRGRWIEPEWYIATVKRILSVSKTRRRRRATPSSGLFDTHPTL